MLSIIGVGAPMLSTGPVGWYEAGLFGSYIGWYDGTAPPESPGGICPCGMYSGV